MFSFLELTDGTAATACELTDNISYALVSYAPGVAPLKDSMLGGAGPYDVVTDQIVVHAMGTTAALAYQAAERLNTILDQAKRWWNNEQVSVVLLRATAQDSTIGPLSAVVRGRPQGGPHNLALPVVWSELFGKYVIQNIQITFLRHSEWFGATQTATSNTAGMPSVLSATFAAGALDRWSPTVTTLSGPLRRSVLALQIGYLITAPADHIEVIEGEAMTASGGGTATITADAANHASGGSVMRMSNAPAQLQLEKAFSAGFAANAFLVGVYAVIRVNGTPTNPITMRLTLFRNTGPQDGPTITIDKSYLGTANIPQPVFLGVVSGARPFTKVMVITEWLDNPVTIDLDYIVCVALDRAPDVGIVASTIDPNFYIPFTGVSSTSPLSVVYDPQALTQPQVAVTGFEATTSTDEPWWYSGDAYLVSKEATVTGLWLATMGAFWRPWDTTAGAQITFTLAYSRRAAYLVPE